MKLPQVVVDQEYMHCMEDMGMRCELNKVHESGKIGKARCMVSCSWMWGSYCISATQRNEWFQQRRLSISCILGY
jgi:hypothetical protein